MREMIPLNRDWRFAREGECTKAVRVDLPHSNVVLPYNYLNERDYQFVSVYEKVLFAPKSWENRRVFLRFEGVMAYAEVFLNDRKVADHKGGYTPFQVELSDFLIYDSENCIRVRVDSAERADIPPCGNVVDYLTYGGIYREVSLILTERDFIRTLRVSPKKCASGECAEVEIALGSLQQDAELTVLLTGNGECREIRSPLTAGAKRAQITFNEAENLAHWSIYKPVLYEITAQLRQNGKQIDCMRTRFGMRFCAFKPDGFYLNDQKIKLIGLNRHQSFPYVGNAMPARVQKRDAEILKSWGLNLVRTSHYPQSPHFLDRCDEIGLLVFEEIPGWQHIGDREWQDVSVHNVQEMIERDYNHPSIVLWGVRINESPDSHDFYLRTNALAHQLDSTRPTGGVRAHTKSELLEDVYTFNEFIHNGGETVFRAREDITGLDHPVALMITESNGHMFPTKRFDTESRLAEHAMRHLRVMNEALGRDDIVGETSWCAFDYNTHGAFGSGDKICYHGVADMFRIPKYAGFALMSQRSAEDGVVLEPLSLVSRGERDGGGIIPFAVATNCDCVRVYKNGTLVGDFYPDRAKFAHLKHPPVIINHLMPQTLSLPVDASIAEEFRSFIARRAEEGILPDLQAEDYPYLENLSEKAGLARGALTQILFENAGGWGQQENTLRLEGIVGNQVVAVREAGETKWFDHMEITADDECLQANGDTYDATRIAIRAVDSMGNLCPFYSAGIAVHTNDLVQMLGPAQFALIGGCIAFWVRTCDKAGLARIQIECNGIQNEIQINIQ